MPGLGHGSWPSLIAVVVLTALVVVPLLELLRVALGSGPGGFRQALAGAGAGRALLNTLATAVVATPLAVVGGTAAALVTERAAIPARRALRIAVLTMLLVPSFVSAQSWARAYGPSGLTDDVFGVALPGVYGAGGVLTVLTIHGVPLAYLVVVGGLASRAEPDLDRAARISGAAGWQALRTVTLPLLRPALLGAGALVFVTTVNAFGIPAVLGLPGGFTTLTTHLYRNLAFAADPAAFERVVVLAVVLVAVAFIAVALGDLFGAVRGAAVRTGAPPGGGEEPGRRRWGPAAAVWAYVVLTTGVPLVALVSTALTRAVGLPPVPANWTLANFGEALRGHTLDALGNSLLLAVAAATLVVGLGALLAAVRRHVIGRGLATAATLTFAVPGSALAVAVLLAYGSRLRDTLLLILVAYLAKFWALGHRTIAGAVDGVPAELRHAARASGAGPLVTAATVTVPLLRPALVGAWLLVFLIAIHELTMSALLYGPGTATLAVAILNAQQLGDLSVTSALATLLTGVVMVAALPLLALGWRRPAPRAEGGPMTRVEGGPLTPGHEGADR